MRTATTPNRTETMTVEIRRILLAVDPSEDGGTALRTATELAAMLRAELAALFVEDVNLLRMARLPFVRELQSLSALQRVLAAASMEQALRQQAQRMQRLLAQQAGKAGIPWSFSVTRGAMAAELLARSSDGDLLVVSRLGATVPARGAYDPSLQSLVSLSRCAVLIARGALMPRRPVVAVYEGGVRGAKVLELALRLAGDQPRPVLVLVPASRRATLEPEVRDRFARAGASLGLRGVEFRDRAALEKAARSIGARIWLQAAPDEPGLEPSLPDVRCSVLLVH